jgi:hypothetical protein
MKFPKENMKKGQLESIIYIEIGLAIMEMIKNKNKVNKDIIESIKNIAKHVSNNYWKEIDVKV